MKVRLISYSKPPRMVQIMEQLDPHGDNLEELVAYCARVATPSNQNNTATSKKLLRYLAREKHWSPFEMVSACLEIETTRDIARQILRHRSFSFQEFSQRYADPTKDLDINNLTGSLVGLFGIITVTGVTQTVTDTSSNVDHPIEDPLIEVTKTVRIYLFIIWIFLRSKFFLVQN